MCFIQQCPSVCYCHQHIAQVVVEQSAVDPYWHRVDMLVRRRPVASPRSLERQDQDLDPHMVVRPPRLLWQHVRGWAIVPCPARSCPQEASACPLSPNVAGAVDYSWRIQCHGHAVPAYYVKTIHHQLDPDSRPVPGTISDEIRPDKPQGLGYDELASVVLHLVTACSGESHHVHPSVHLFAHHAVQGTVPGSVVQPLPDLDQRGFGFQQCAGSVIHGAVEPQVEEGVDWRVADLGDADPVGEHGSASLLGVA